MTTVKVLSGDITIVPSGALITAINPGGLWFGGVDQAIYTSSGSMFHDQARAKMPLDDGSVIFAQASGAHKGEFHSVIFVVDGFSLPIGELVTRSLKRATQLGIQTITIPVIRTGVMAGKYESREEALEGFATAINKFIELNPFSFTSVRIVVLNNTKDQMLLHSLCATEY